MTNQTPKAFDFGDEPTPPDNSAAPAAVPKAFDFGEAEAPARAVGAMPPKVLSFDDLPEEAAPTALAKAAPKPLFDSEDHPAVRDALSHVRAEHPALFAHSEQRLAALFRRILPVRLALVTEWGETPLMEQAVLMQPVTDLVRKFSELGVPALLDEALASTRPPTGVLDKLFRRSTPPAMFTPALTGARTQLLQLIEDSEQAKGQLDASARTLTLHWVVLAVVSELTSRGPDATLLEVLLQRRALIQQAVRQAELSMLQMAQVRQQAVELVGQISSFLSVTLPALEMAQAHSAKP